VPMFVILLATAIAALVTFMQVPPQMLPQIMLGSIDNFVLLTVPGFLFAGELMGRGSVARRLVDLVQEGVGGVRGSLGVTAVGTSCIFGAISGASAACVATVGKIMLPAMRRGGYPDHFSAGLITAVGAIDIVIPPSIPMIVYGAAASESVARLYAAGVIPGLMIAAIIAAYVMWFAHRNKIPVGEAFNLKRFLPAVWRGGWALGAPAIILGGIYSGAFSPTEAAAVACVYSIDLVHFGIVFTVNIAIGLFHPPFGINIFTAQAALKLPLATIYRRIMPFIVLYLIALALITYIPEISLIGTRWVFN
jgi:C4-dicarboxylate transporter DctM subunit